MRRADLTVNRPQLAGFRAVKKPHQNRDADDSENIGCLERMRMR